ncbi:DedA protein [Rhodovastum atsumiense]|uniref:Phosphatase PAP2 family protein n=1 Tax=Rhodovastum atsumiense TaxID=504468 RepID=A0A5M6IZE4_9PROT|nr:phosphatase PAP2 family protein [Rhodovastum atsumiense]KAA5613720.1 phosphatase PAP2 family protein [Rhodovastum atsumiense]CAH2599644.1 DedA protein [Rhodovastum atsumiense]
MTPEVGAGAEGAGTVLLLAIILLVVAALLLVRRLAWLALGQALALAPRWAVRLRRSGAWVRTRPLRAWLEARYPRLHAALAARLTPRRFSGLPALLLILAALYAAALFGGLAEVVVSGEATAPFDDRINAALAPYRAPWLLRGFVWVTTLGESAALGAVAVTATGFLWASRRFWLIMPLWLTLVGAQMTTWIGKFAIARPRPEFLDGVATALSPSFPSAHATGAMATFGFVAYAILRDLPNPRRRFDIAYWTGVAIILVGFSRIFLSVHHTTDVASGFLVGGFWLLVGFTVAEWRRPAEPG